MSILMLAALSLMAMPQEPQRPIFTYDDYPAWAVGSSFQAIVYFDVLVDPTGKVVRCDVAALSGDPRFGPVLCGVVERSKGNFGAAIGMDGTPTFGVIRMRRMLLQADQPQPAEPIVPADLMLTIKPIPGLTGPRAVSLLAQIGTDGRVVECVPTSDESEAKLAAAGCAQMRSTYQNIRKNAAGDAVSYVRAVKVIFTPDV